MYYLLGFALYDLFDFFSAIYASARVGNTEISVNKKYFGMLTEYYLSYSDGNAITSSGKHG